MTDDKQLALLANTIRQDVLKALTAAGSGHPGGSLGMADIFTALYFHALKHDPQNPTWQERDRLLLSNGHICPVMYAAMAHVGYFPTEELMTLRKFGARLQGHPHRVALPGIETTSGPLGSGVSQAVGMALAARLDNKRHHVYVLTSDGEHQEGNTWEGVMMAAAYKLDNIIQIIDRNNIQIEGNTEDVMPLDSLRAKYSAFNWNVREIDGHNFSQIIEAINWAKDSVGKPTVIIATTVPGRGVSFMEHQYSWHGKAPKPEELAAALKELQTIREQIETNTYDY
ncbi:MAG: transketolase [Candidatus Kerfeldbacteria bacterium]|nr:transketolase [Candidatus Kerfeldbacteria bacterium]